MRPLNWWLTLRPRDKSININFEKYWSTIRGENYEESFPAMEVWLMKNGRPYPRLTTSIFDKVTVRIMNYLKFHRLKLVSIVSSAVALIIACNMPVEQEETFGHVLTWTVNQKSAEASKLVETLPWVDNARLSITKSTGVNSQSTTFHFVTSGSTENEVEEWMEDLESIKEITSVKLFPLQGMVKRPAYAAALRSFFRINIDATELSDTEVEEEIRNQLQAIGINDARVEYKRNLDGKWFINLSIPPHESEPGTRKVEMYIGEGNRDYDAKFMNKLRFSFDREQFAGKSDKEIKSIIEEKLKSQGIEGAEIFVNGGTIQVRLDKSN